MTLRRPALALALLAGLLAPAAARAQAADSSRLVIVVRHAEKAAAPAGDPALSEAGTARAAALQATLQHANVGAVVVTPYRRTAATGAAVAAARGLTPVTVPIGSGVPEHARSVAEAVRAQPAGTVLVVGHSNTVTAIVAALGGPALPDLCDSQYATLYVLRVAPGKPTALVTSSYGAADPAEKAGCPAGMKP